MALKDKFVVRLTADQRQELEHLAATGRRSAATITRSRILLKADADGADWPDDRIAEALDVSVATVARVRKKFALGGLAAAVELEVVESIDPATVCRTLKKTRSSPG